MGFKTTSIELINKGLDRKLENKDHKVTSSNGMNKY